MNIEGAIQFLFHFLGAVIEHIVMNPELLSAIGSFLEAIAVCTATIIAWLGYTNWKDQQIFQRKLDLTEKLVPLLDELVGIYDAVTSRLISSDEYEDRPIPEYETPQEKTFRQSCYAHFRRLQRSWPQIMEFIQFKSRFQIYYGKQHGPKFYDVYEVFNSLRVKYEVEYEMGCLTHYESREDKAGLKAKKKDKEEMDRLKEKLEAAVSSLSDTCDEFIMKSRARLQ